MKSVILIQTAVILACLGFFILVLHHHGHWRKPQQIRTNYPDCEIHPLENLPEIKDYVNRYNG